MGHVPMCVVCGEFEAGTFTGSVMFCSEKCEDIACEEFREEYYPAGDGWGNDDIMSMYDDDPSPYAGTYSEE